MALDKAYNSKDHEDHIYQAWEQGKLFKPEVHPDGAPFTIMIPPPNATGQLHLGHAVMLALQDVMIRYHRMKGDKTLWVPGTDHAAIATQTKVEKILKKEQGKTKEDLGREPFLDEVKKFVADSQDTIRNQVRKMGASVDWERERYTFEDTLNRMVNETFVKMYKDGLIYRGHRIVNWDPIGQTNVADDELVYKEVQEPFYTFQYGPFQISTSRPETKFGDKYVVVHPDDERYKQFKHGDTFEAEWINGPVTATVIKDASIDMTFGTGAMTITPWHDVADFDMAQKYKLDKQQIIDFEGRLLDVAEEFTGMKIEDARPKIVEKLKAKNLVVSVDENYRHNVAVSDRYEGRIEPQIREQWFVDVNKKVVDWKNTKMSLKEVMQDTIKSGDIEIIPDRFNKTYFHWIDNLRDWCISRQIWWGHRIPVWYKGDQMHVGVQAPAGDGWEQDPDTLDTWFSSGLWTWSTLIDNDLAKDYTLTLEDLLKKSVDFQTFHPTSVLETGYDILFFWVARMILMTTYATGQIPFKHVYLHGLMRDKQGRKMSKSLGNGIDPLDMIDKYGADAVRLSLMIGNTPGNDGRIFDEKIEGYRNFVTKIWNIARFILMTVKQPHLVEVAPKAADASDEWILSRFQQLITEVTNHIEGYRFSMAGEALYAFTWSELADWYVEDSKVIGGKDEILLYILGNLIKLWHPYTPFVTEVLWKELQPSTDQPLIIQPWPQAQKELSNSNAERSYQQYQEIVNAIRNARNQFKIAYSQPLEVIVDLDLSELMISLITKRVKASEIKIKQPKTDGVRYITYHVAGTKVHINVEGLIDITAEQKRLNKELAQAEKYLAGLNTKLGNNEFVKSAPAAIVDEQRAKQAETTEKIASIRQQLESLS